MKYFVVIALTVLLASAAYATPPPAHGGYPAGWGMNPNNWEAQSGGFSAFGLYDPNYVGGGDAWVVGWNPLVYIQYAPISIELWVEMYSLQTYQYTSYQFHRLGNAAENLCWTIEGTIASNNGQWIGLTAGLDPLTHLWFRHNIFGNPNPPDKVDLPITWLARWGRGMVYGQDIQWGWLPPEPVGDDLYILIPESCDHWFQFEGCVSIPYHLGDGYYSLTLAGCPAPEL